MQPPVLQFAFVSDSRSFESLRESWSTLCTNLEHPHLFFSFDWWWNAWKFVAEPRGYRLQLLTGTLDGRFVVVWPLTDDNGVLRMLSSGTPEYRDIIVEESHYSSQWIDQAWSYLVSSTRADTFIFQNLRQPNRLAQKLIQATNARPIGGGWCAVIRLDRFSNWEEFAAALPKSLMNDQRRQWRRVRKEMPGVSFRLVDKTDEIHPLIDWVIRHKIAWADARGKDARLFKSEAKRALLEAAAETALNDGRLVLAALSDGDTVLSAGWGYLFGSEFTFHAFAYDVDYATYSPSRLLLECLVKLCFDRGAQTFDFMPGEEAYKRTWATDYVLTDSYIGPFSRRGAWLLKLARLKPASVAAPNVIKRLYRRLPRRVREVAQSRLRAYQSVVSVMPRPPVRQRSEQRGCVHLREGGHLCQSG